jgi:hypothetical protein
LSACCQRSMRCPCPGSVVRSSRQVVEDTKCPGLSGCPSRGLERGLFYWIDSISNYPLAVGTGPGFWRQRCWLAALLAWRHSWVEQ